MLMVQASWDRWNPDRDLKPERTWAMWQNQLCNKHFRFVKEIGILWDTNVWVWKTPAWVTSSVSEPQTGQALLVNEQYCYKHSTRVSASTCVAISTDLASSSSSSSPSSCYLTPIPSLEHVVHVVLILFILLLQPPLQLPLLQPLPAYYKQARQQSAP